MHGKPGKSFWVCPVILCPGKVISCRDGDEHYVDSWHLAKLYCLKSGEYVIARNEYDLHIWKRQYPDALVLRPRYDGKYGRPPLDKEG